MTSVGLPCVAGSTAFFVRELARHGERTAVVTAEGQLSYRELRTRVDEAAARLGPGRRLVLLAAVNSLDVLVMYLAALSAGHVVLLAPGDGPGPAASLVTAYDPDVVVRPVGAAVEVEHRRDGSGHDLHPDLALLLSTSGSTGSPKLVRLSYANLQANAESIAEYLELRPEDRAPTTLPMYYCYGLSVVHSHLWRGAGLILTSRSVTDPCFWDLFRAGKGTSLAGVPYTFDLLDRVGFDQMPLPHLRYVTQAGGRLPPDRVSRYARLGQRDGWDLVVMYGQTEATARMAYLPPRLAATHPHTIGMPIPGGSFRLEPLAGAGRDDGQVGDSADGLAGAGGVADAVGELVYTGPNVMMGYADSAADLALGSTLDELRTGDIARRTDDGLYEIVGRRTRFAKVFGLRIDLRRVEEVLATDGLSACCVTDDAAIDVVVAGPADLLLVRGLVARTCRLPDTAVRVHLVDALPRLPTGKVDLVTMRRIARAAAPPVPAARPVAASAHGREPSDVAADVRRLFADVLRSDEVTEDSTFVSLGGDSLSYVDLSLRLEDLLGHLPASWHTTPLRDLAPAARPRRGRSASVEISALLRAVAIVLIVGTHANTFDAIGGLLGGAHLLIAVAGYNFARFHLTSAPRSRRVRGLLRSTAQIAVPSVLFITALVLVMDEHNLANIVLLTNVFGPDLAGPTWEFWFIEALVQILLVLAVLVSIPVLDRAQRRFPFAVAMGALAVGLLTRFEVVVLPAGPRHTQTSVAVFWLFALGWAAAAATTVWRRLAVTAAATLTIPGFFADARREDIVLGGLVLLIWISSVRCPRPLRRLAGVLASSSLCIYLTHWQVFPLLQVDHPVLALLASLAVGVAAWRLWSDVTALFGRLRLLPRSFVRAGRRPVPHPPGVPPASSSRTRPHKQPKVRPAAARLACARRRGGRPDVEHPPPGMLHVTHLESKVRMG
ncbi:AMP-binding protein [Pseudofrankia sp. BMG5.36]|uniref:AMP-binding protein n=1 Tax=Pseudofrankia sp. BMG5.36 TaxID=1834512 RepID=UPI0009F35E91|nr:AMP-binding protein [Pseudofrankia sp. BMG5.36]